MPMNLNRVNQVTPLFQNEKTNPIQTNTKSDVNFSTILKNAIQKVNNVEHESDLKTEALAQGKVDDLHDVMLSAQKANVTIETAVQMQQKVIDAYNEVMRMQI